MGTDGPARTGQPGSQQPLPPQLAWARVSLGQSLRGAAPWGCGLVRFPPRPPLKTSLWKPAPPRRRPSKSCIQSVILEAPTH